MFKRKIKFKDNEYYIPIYLIWYKSALENNCSKINHIRWCISPSYINIMRVCYICKWIFYIFLIFLLGRIIEYMPWHTYDINLFFIFMNLLVMIGPILLIELIILYFIPINIEKVKE